MAVGVHDQLVEHVFGGQAVACIGFIGREIGLAQAVGQAEKPLRFFAKNVQPSSIGAHKQAVAKIMDATNRTAR